MLDQLPEQSLPKPEHIAVDDDWFEIVKVADYLYAIMEPRHYEHTVLNLLIGDGRAILIDTGCGIATIAARHSANSNCYRRIFAQARAHGSDGNMV